MPVLDISLERINELLGQEISLDELEELVFQLGMELESYEYYEGETQLKIEITPDRPDLLLSYGFVRTLKKYMGIERGLERLKVIDGNYVIEVDKKVEKVRPYIGAIVVRNIKLTERDLLDLIYAQEKLHETFCRSRTKASIGLYPLDKVRWPLKYTTLPPDEINFRPLEFDVKLNGLEILEKHPTGQKYSFILKGKKEFPIFMDNSNNVLSMPPIINSEDHGKVTPGDKNVLVEVTGTHKQTMDRVLTILTYAFEMIGGEIYKVNVKYPTHTETYPKIEPEEKVVNSGYINEVLGVNFAEVEIVKLLEKMGYGIKKVDNGKIHVLIPPYRADILHDVDIVDDVARAYTFDKFEPELTPVFTVGGYLERSYIVDRIREVFVGLGYNEVFTFALTSKEDQFIKMRLEPIEVAEIGGAKERRLNMVRVWILPELLKMLYYNKDKRKPIRLFEISEIVKLDPEFESGTHNRYHIAAITAHSDATFTEIRRILEHILDSLNLDYRFIRKKHDSFIEGRTAGVLVNGEEIGFVGEIHPEVLLNWGIDFPVSGFEIDLNKALKWDPKELETAT